MLDEVQIAIDGAAIASEVKLRLQPCLKWLAEALGNCAPVDALMVASATPRGALVFAAGREADQGQGREADQESRWSCQGRGASAWPI
jgi:hypothetical protein